ncbi:hypothetical protein PROFUN_05183 [Planoprotostelium fungivorum]|uniref:Uncharacterized protein n=1 Tax=Planoprotostelium fungivorum TaxID=1890364 RepID=A0A2P6NRF4_9EUKA|nr:hypothetical protein PROFUN_05183 [Planoprotostelium fungivorum]
MVPKGAGILAGNKHSFSDVRHDNLRILQNLWRKLRCLDEASRSRRTTAFFRQRSKRLDEMAKLKANEIELGD